MASDNGFSEEPAPFTQTSDSPYSVPLTRLKLDSAGRVVIPGRLRAAMAAEPGDFLTAEVVDGELRIQSRATLLRRMRSEAEASRSRHPGSVIDELISDRREEARREDARHDRLEREAGDAARLGAKDG